MQLGLIGYGTIAQTLVGAMAQAGIDLDALVVLVRAGREGDVPQRLACADRVTVVSTAADLIAAAPDLVLECAGHSAVQSHVPQVLRAGIDTVVVSVGALADPALAKALDAAAREGCARYILPSGAVGGLDILGAFALGGPVAVQYEGTKPPAAWKGTPAEAAVDLDALTAPAVFFQGTAREAALAFPKNANVAATLALAGAGLDDTRVALIADPQATGNRHAYSVTGALGRVTVEIDNAASGNARTSMATIYALLREVRNWKGPMVI